MHTSFNFLDEATRKSVNNIISEYFLGKISMKEAIDAIAESIDAMTETEEFEERIKNYYDSFIPVKEIGELKWKNIKSLK